VEIIDGGIAVNFDSELLLKQIGIDLVKEADDLEQVDEGTDKFRLFARDHTKSADGHYPGSILTASVISAGTEDEEWVLNGLASSTVIDRHGDSMLPSALIDMERAANDNLTMFLNHEYKVPEDVAGSVKSAKISSYGVEQETGAPIYDLDYAFRVDRTNKRAEQSFKSQRGGTKLGLSIGARIPEGGAIRNKKTGRLLIAHVDLLETSIVGVPANPRSWVEQAKKSVEDAIQAHKVWALGELKDGVEQVAALAMAKAAELEAAEPNVGVEVPEGATATLSVEDDGTSTVTITNDPPADATYAAPEPDVIQSSTPSQEAPQSDPGPEGDVATEPVVEAATEPEVLKDLENAPSSELVSALLKAQSALSETSTELILVRQALQVSEQRASALERERDQVIAGARDLAADTAQIITRLGSLPVGQKASFKRIAQDFDDGLESAKDIYGDEFVTQLRSFKK
jgi:phage head maturation protease